MIAVYTVDEGETMLKKIILGLIAYQLVMLIYGASFAYIYPAAGASQGFMLAYFQRRSKGKERKGVIGDLFE